MSQAGLEPTRVSLVAIPDAVISTLSGIYDVMNAGSIIGTLTGAAPASRPFRTEIVGEKEGMLELASGIPIKVQRSIAAEKALVVSGRREELVSSGASTSWHDLVLYLIARFAGSTAAQSAARSFALLWHQDGLAPYIVFEGRQDHGDSEVLAAQEWLSRHFAVASPVEEMVKRSRLASSTFKRRFANATGLTPIVYVQRLRIEDAKRRLERTAASVDEVGWQVGYEAPAFFRRLFKRTTGLSPAVYRRRFQVPGFLPKVKNSGDGHSKRSQRAISL